ncbi:MAG: hypothetical protein V1838_02125 [Patescibacteria group bacterium]
MDIISHGLWGAAVAPQKELIISSMISGIVPDLWTIPFLLRYAFVKRLRKMSLSEFWNTIPPELHKLYHYFHSFVILVVIAVIMVWLFKVIWWLLLPWLIHLVLDIFSHQGDLRAKMFYPLSKYRFRSFTNWFESPVLTIVNWVVVLIIVTWRILVGSY